MTLPLGTQMGALRGALYDWLQAPGDTTAHALGAAVGDQPDEVAADYLRQSLPPEEVEALLAPRDDRALCYREAVACRARQRQALTGADLLTLQRPFLGKTVVMPVLIRVWGAVADQMPRYDKKWHMWEYDTWQDDGRSGWYYANALAPTGGRAAMHVSVPLRVDLNAGVAVDAGFLRDLVIANEACAGWIVEALRCEDTGANGEEYTRACRRLADRILGV